MLSAVNSAFTREINTKGKDARFKKVEGEQFAAKCTAEFRPRGPETGPLAVRSDCSSIAMFAFTTL
jgi:hypothetical protein